MPTSANTPQTSVPPPSPVPNLNSPPGNTIPNAPPSSGNISALSTSNTTREQSMTQLQTAPALENSEAAQYQRIFYYSSVGIAAACPIIAFMPPRKFDLFTFGLGVAFCMSSGYVLEARTGKGLLWHVGSMIPSQGNTERRAREAAEKKSREEGRGRLTEMVRESEARIAEERRKAKEGRGLVKSVWMGNERDDWVEERKKREDEALESGRGYGGLIVDYITEGLGFKKEPDEEDSEEKKGK